METTTSQTDMTTRTPQAHIARNGVEWMSIQEGMDLKQENLFT